MPGPDFDDMRDDAKGLFKQYPWLKWVVGGVVVLIVLAVIAA